MNDIAVFVVCCLVVAVAGLLIAVGLSAPAEPAAELPPCVPAGIVGPHLQV